MVGNVFFTSRKKNVNDATVPDFAWFCRSFTYLGILNKVISARIPPVSEWRRAPSIWIRDQTTKYSIQREIVTLEKLLYHRPGLVVQNASKSYGKYRKNHLRRHSLFLSYRFCKFNTNFFFLIWAMTLHTEIHYRGTIFVTSVTNMMFNTP